MSGLLEVEGLRSGYGGTEVLHGVDLTVASGESVALLGPNGSGKTTFLSTVSGLVRASIGSIVFDSVPIHRRKPEAIVEMGLVQVPQGRRVFPNFTTRRNLEIGAFTRSDRAQAQFDIERFLERFPLLGSRSDQPAGLLSGGEQQLLALARALMASPKLLMLDEPSLGLAPGTVKTVFDYLGELRSAGLTILVVEQNIAAALAVADRVYVLAAGDVQLDARTADIAESDLVGRAYLGG